MVRCSVLGCQSDGEKKEPDISFHSFPKNENLLQKWIKTTGRQNWTPKKYAKICSRHFKPNMLYKKEKLTLLMPNAVPLLIATQEDEEDHISPSVRITEVNTSSIQQSVHIQQPLIYLPDSVNLSDDNTTTSLGPSTMTIKNLLDSVNLSDDNITTSLGPSTMTIKLGGGGTSKEQLSSETSSCGPSDDDDLADVDVDEEMRYITTRVGTLKQQSKDYDKIFEEFGETVTSRLKSLPIESALRLHRSLEIVIEKFCSSLPEPAETKDSSNLEEFLSFKKKGKAPQKGPSTKKKSSKEASEAFSSDKTIQVKVEPATTSSDPKLMPLDVTFTPNRLAKANEEQNTPVSTPLVKKSAGNESSISYGINPGSQSITVVKTAWKKNKKRPFFEDPTTEISEPEKQARLDDDEVDLEIKLEEDECIVKTEHDSDNDCDDPLL